MDLQQQINIFNKQIEKYKLNSLLLRMKYFYDVYKMMYKVILHKPNELVMSKKTDNFFNSFTFKNILRSLPIKYNIKYNYHFITNYYSCILNILMINKINNIYLPPTVYFHIMSFLNGDKNLKHLLFLTIKKQNNNKQFNLIKY